MKKILSLLLTLLCFVELPSCKDDDKDNGSNDIVGIWKQTSYSQSKEWDEFDEEFGYEEEDTQYYVYFTEDHRCYDITYHPQKEDCSVELTEYSYSDGSYYGAYGVKLNIKVTGKTMVYDMFGFKQEYTKVPSLPDAVMKKINCGDVEDLRF